MNATIIETITKKHNEEPYTVYQIEIEILTPPPRSWTVERRYSEFLELHNTLKKAYPYVRFPAFPGKSIFSSKNDPQLVATRKHTLNNYLNTILANVAIASNATLLEFLEPTSTDPSFHQALLESSPTASGSATPKKPVSEPSPSSTTKKSTNGKNIVSNPPGLEPAASTTVKSTTTASKPSTPTPAPTSTSTKKGHRSTASNAVAGLKDKLKETSNKVKRYMPSTSRSTDTKGMNNNGSGGNGSGSGGGESGPTYEVPNPKFWDIIQQGTPAQLVHLLKKIPKSQRRTKISGSYPSHDGNTLLHIATIVGRPDMVKLLLSAGADPRVLNASAQSPLHLAGKHGRTRIAVTLLYPSLPPSSINGIDSAGKTPFEYALANQMASKPDLVRWLGSTALIQGVRSKDVDRVTKIIALGASVDDVDVAGRTALHYACQLGVIAMVKLLVTNGANPMISDDYGFTPIHVCSSHGYTEALQIIISTGFSSKPSNSMGRGSMRLSISLETPLNISEQPSAETTPKNLSRKPSTTTVLGSMSGATMKSMNQANKAKGDERSKDDGAAKTTDDEEKNQKDGKEEEKQKEKDKRMSSPPSAEEITNALSSIPMSPASKRKYNTRSSALPSSSARSNTTSPKMTVRDVAPPAEVGSEKSQVNGSGESEGAVVLVSSSRAAKKSGTAVKMVADPLSADRRVSALPLSSNEAEGSQDKSININVSTTDGLTPLILAASAGSMNTIKLLLQQPGLDVNQGAGDGRTALHAATLSGHTECAQLLIDSGASLASVDESGSTPLHIAARYGKFSTYHALRAAPSFDSSADGVKDNAGKTAGEYVEVNEVFVAAEKGDLEKLRSFTQQGRDLPNIMDSDGRSLLHAAAAFGQVKAVEYLIETGADVDHQTDEFEQTALHFAVAQQHVSVVEALLKAGAHANCLDEDSDAPIQYAAKLLNSTIMSLLIEKGEADADMTNNNDQTSLHILAKVALTQYKASKVVKNDLIKCVDLLKKTDLDFDAKDEFDKTAADYLGEIDELKNIFSK